MFFGWAAETWGVVIALVVSIGWPIVQLFAKTTAKTEADEAVEKAQEQLNDHETRVIRLEEQLKALPQSREFQRLSEKVADMAGDIKSLITEQRGQHQSQERIEKSISLINETLMQQSKQ